MWPSGSNDGNAGLPVQRRQALLDDRQAQVATEAPGQTVAVPATPPDDQERENESSERRAWDEPPPRATAVRLRRWTVRRRERLRGGHDDAERHRDGKRELPGTTPGCTDRDSIQQCRCREAPHSRCRACVEAGDRDGEVSCFAQRDLAV